MRKKLLILGMCVALVFSMTACGTASSERTASNGELKDNSKADMQGTKYKTTVKLGQYKGLKVGETNAKATEEEIEKAIQNVLESNATDKKYEEGALEMGDTANIDFEGKINGVAFEGGTSKGYNLKIGSGSFIDGFETGLVGKTVGETVDLNLKFPDDYKNSATGEISEHAGKDVVFTVKINYFNRSIVPELTDAFVKEYCTAYKVETVAGLKEYLDKQLVLNKKLSAIWQTLLDSTEITYDEDEVAGLVEQMKNQYIQYYNAYNMQLKDYLEYANMTEEEFDKQLDTSVRNSLKNIVIAMTVAREEGLEVTEKEYREEVDPDVEAGTFDSLEAFQAMYPKQDTVDSLLYYDVLEWIADKCEIVPDSEIETTTKEPETTTAAK
ncbi:MAG: trigger factor [Lachnospiraceae bacterium]|nr:trigger factor [Lachnospiraceae bacterium]